MSRKIRILLSGVLACWLTAASVSAANPTGRFVVKRAGDRVEVTGRILVEAQDGGVLLLARDGAGVKPLYYAETPRGTVFASELKSLLQESSVPRDIDGRSVRDHLLYL